MIDRIRVIKGDITKVSSDAIVNAANSTLLGGGGVDGDIHRIAGPELLEECKKLNSCPTGESRITDAYKLPSKYIIHTVGPIWKGGHRDEHKLLASCYMSSLKIARDLKLRSIAFPAISSGAYRFPLDQAANIAITEARRFISNYNEPDEIIFVLYTDEIYKLYLKLTTDG